MIDPLSIFCAVTGSMQFLLQVKKYFDKRQARRRRRQEQQQLSWGPDDAGDQQQQMMITSYSPLPPNYYQNHVHTTPNYHYPAHNVVFYVLVPYTQPPPAPWPLLDQQWPPFNPHTTSDSYSRSLPANLSLSHHHNHLHHEIYPHNHHHLQSHRHHHNDHNHHHQPCHWVWLGGHMDLVVPQEAPHNLGMRYHERLGMRTGRESALHYHIAHAHDHWNSLQRESFPDSPGAIAVVDWTRGNIDMFVESHGVYFRNYRIYSCNVVAFANLYKENEVFSGEISHQRLTRCNKEIKVVENLGHIPSTNSWTSLGIYDDDVVHVEYEVPIFIQMVRGAVLGIVCCLYESPCELNVDMESTYYNQYDLVHINTHKENSTLVKRDQCCFSVFSFNTKEWATENVLVA